MSRRQIILTGTSNQIDGLRWQSGSKLRIGRLPELEIVLNDASISRQHAEIVAGEQGWHLCDLGSTNGTYVNGRRVTREGQFLQLNDLLVCGNLAMVVTIVEDEVPPVTPTPGATLDETTQEGQLIKTSGTHLRPKIGTAESPSRIKTSGSYVRVQATAKRSWEQAVEMLVLHSNQRLVQGQHFLTLLRAGYHLTHSASLDELLQSILDETVAVLDAQRGAIVLEDEHTGQLTLRAVSLTKKNIHTQRCFSTTLAQRCYTQGDSLLCRDVNNDANLRDATSVAHGSMASIVCALLRSPRKRLGVLHLDRGPMQDPFTQDDFCLADAMAASVSVGIESAQLVESQRTLFLQTVNALARAVELRDNYTGNHTQRVATYSMLLARELNLSPWECQQIQIGTPLHDIGKIAIDDAILRKPGKLTAEEFEAMKAHTLKGAAILETIPGLAPMIPIIRHHHERWDGTGYPDGLIGDQISKLARIVAVADAFDAMTSDRPYRAGMPADAAFQELIDESGTHFDPECVEAFLRVRPHVETLLSQDQSPHEVFNRLADSMPQSILMKLMHHGPAAVYR